MPQLKLNVTDSKILDAGCGEGKNSIYLARLGGRVDAWDVSPLAIQNAKIAWQDYDSVNWVIGDVQRMTLEANAYDVIVMYGLLHCFESKDAITSFVDRAKRATSDGGAHILVAFNSRKQELEAHPGFQPVLMSHDEFLSLYNGWELLVSTDEDLFETHPHNGIPHCHSMTRILARKRN